MKTSTRFAVFGLTFAMTATAYVEAQPEGGRGGRRGGPGAGGVSAEQVLGILAFDEKAGVTDKQLVKLRTALTGVYEKRQKLMNSIRSGERDFQDVREEMMGLRVEILQVVSSVLSEKQVEALKERMQRQQRGRGGRGGEGRGRRGSQGGGARS